MSGNAINSDDRPATTITCSGDPLERNVLPRQVPRRRRTVSVAAPKTTDLKNKKIMHPSGPMIRVRYLNRMGDIRLRLTH